MISNGICRSFTLALVVIMIISLTPSVTFAKKSKSQSTKLALNVIDRCWRLNPNWRTARQQLATCSAGFTGKMTNNIGADVVSYIVTDPTDNPIHPKPGTLRYGATRGSGKVWITFQRNMRIKLLQPLLVSSFTTIDGRGASIHITGGSCILLYKVSNVIIHGIRLHDCKPRPGGPVMGPNAKLMHLAGTDGDAIRLVGSSKIWIDHNTFYECTDGLLDVTRGSTDVTVSNNWFRNHDKVMLLGHDDGFKRDKSMRVTVVFNHFGPDLVQRMPRVRHGYAHVVNNLYKGWISYAIGGSMNPSVMSQSNLFIAPKSEKKEVTWRQDNTGEAGSFNLQSVGDVFENGACFKETKGKMVRPPYNREQMFQVADAKSVRSLTRSSGALRCPKSYRC